MTLDRALLELDRAAAVSPRHGDRVRRGRDGVNPRLRAAAGARRGGRREGDRDRRPRPARLRPGRRLAARRSADRLGANRLTRGAAPARPRRTARARRAPRPPARRLPAMGTARRPDHGSTTRHAEPRALADWQAAVAVHGVRDAVLIARDNELRDRLNQHARAHRRDHGQLGADVAYGPVTLAVGDRVICRRNDRAADVDNGTRGTVRATHPDRVVVETDAGTDPRAARRLRRPARRARLLPHRPRHAGRHRRTRHRARDAARPDRRLVLHRPLPRPRHHPPPHRRQRARREPQRRARASSHQTSGTPLARPATRCSTASAPACWSATTRTSPSTSSAEPANAGRVDDLDLQRAASPDPPPHEHGAEQTDHERAQPGAASAPRRARVATRPARRLPLGALARLERPTSSVRSSPTTATSSRSGCRICQRRDGFDPRRPDRPSAPAHRGARRRRHAPGGSRTPFTRRSSGGRTLDQSAPNATPRPTDQPARTRSPHRRRPRGRVELGRAPTWLVRDLGPRPDDRFGARTWDRAALLSPLPRHTTRRSRPRARAANRPPTTSYRLAPSEKSAPPTRAGADRPRRSRRRTGPLTASAFAAAPRARGR